jgi:hypothetical protein
MDLLDRAHRETASLSLEQDAEALILVGWHRADLRDRLCQRPELDVVALKGRS